MDVDGSGSGSGSGHAPRVPSLPPPCPKSPLPYPDFYGKRRDMARILILERERSFLEEELKFVEGLQPASRCCKEVVDFVTANGDPFIATNRKISKCRRFWKWLCGPCLSCFNCLWICCCTGCPIRLKPPQCISCSLPKCCKIQDCCTCLKISCSLTKCSCWCNPFSRCFTKNPCSCAKITCCSLKPLKSLLCSECCCSCSCKCTCSWPQCSCPKCFSCQQCSCPQCLSPKCSSPQCSSPQCSCPQCSCLKCSGVCGCFSCIKDCCCYPCRCICC